MRDTQQSLLLHQQKQAQQRQILAMMGIGQWVRPDSPTLKISDIDESEILEKVPAIAALTEQQPVFAPPIEQHDSPANSRAEVVATDSPVASDPVINNNAASKIDTSKINSLDSESFNADNADNDTDSSNAENKSYNFNDLNSFSDSEVAEEEVNASGATSLEPTHLDSISSEKVAPFDLQGGRYGNWVLIVDIQALNNDTQKLWQNMTQALSLECETSSFPICEGMDTAELANASLAGYIFKIGQSEDIKIAVLTALPDGLTHPNFTESPSLEAMLIDSTLKRQLWQQISNE